MSRDFDVIVIGAGHNGLVCAAYLAMAGLSVCVLERYARVGGAAITEEFHPGFKNSAASYTVSLLQSKIVDELRLREHGLRIVPRPLANFVPSLSGAGLKLPADTAERQAAIAVHSEADALHYREFSAELDAVTRLLRPLLLQAPLDPAGGWRAQWRNLKLLPGLPRPSPRQLSLAWRLVTGSAGDWLDAHFQTDLLKGALGFDAAVGHFASPYQRGSGYLLLHHCLGEAAGRPGAWGHALGGMGSISEAIAAAARGAGAVIHCGHDAERIEYRRGRFQLSAGGASWTAAKLASAVHPQILFTRLLDADLLPPAFLQRIRAWKSESASFRLNVALSELPDFACLPGRKLAEHHASGILISPSLRYLHRAQADSATDGMSAAPVIELVIASTLDPSLAPPGAHVASLFCQHFRRCLPNGRGWGEQKQTAIDRIVDTVDRYAPNFRRSILAVQAYTPEDLETRFALLGGDIFHGVMSPDQLYWSRPASGFAQYRAPVAGLYMCGSGTHPGGGVSGAPGHNAARAILADWRGGRGA